VIVTAGMDEQLAARARDGVARHPVQLDDHLAAGAERVVDRGTAIFPPGVSLSGLKYRNFNFFESGISVYPTFSNISDMWDKRR